ncbi:putative ribonuclease H protein, partial [Trifolium medium]|nr:putative ribonuclease H protein [Trifolium medium]
MQAAHMWNEWPICGMNGRWYKAFLKVIKLTNRSNKCTASSRTLKHVNETDQSVQQWMHPPPGYIKCNVDASCYGTAEATGWGWCARDHQGRFIVAGTNIMYAKLNTIERRSHGYQGSKGGNDTK